MSVGCRVSLSSASASRSPYVANTTRRNYRANFISVCYALACDCKRLCKRDIVLLCVKLSKHPRLPVINRSARVHDAHISISMSYMTHLMIQRSHYRAPICVHSHVLPHSLVCTIFHPKFRVSRRSRAALVRITRNGINKMIMRGVNCFSRLICSLANDVEAELRNLGLHFFSFRVHRNYRTWKRGEPARARDSFARWFNDRIRLLLASDSGPPCVSASILTSIDFDREISRQKIRDADGV